MSSETTARDLQAPLRNVWYHVAPARRLEAGKMAGRVVMGEPIVFGRTREGKVFGLRDICPHRAVPLSFGHFDGQEISCHFHGWRFSPDGVCVAIPTLVTGQELDVSRICTRAYEVREWQNNIWVWIGDKRERYPDPPTLPEVCNRSVRLDFAMEFPCAAEYAIVAFFDPAHTPYVHKSWWYSSRRPPHEKEKRYVPVPFGMRMERAVSKANGLAYRLLGGDVSTEISFYLPSIRVEHVRAGKHELCSLTTVTPIDDKTCRMTQVFNWTIPWLDVAQPLIGHFARRFMRQDREAMRMQQVGMKYAPPLLVIDDADTQIKWYYRLKREFWAAEEEGRAFVNPLKERVLRWKT